MDSRESSPERRAQRRDTGSDYEEEGSCNEDEYSDGDYKNDNLGNYARDHDQQDRKSSASDVENVLQSTEPGVKSGDDFRERVKNRQNSHEPLSLERTVAKGGEQVDFRGSLRRKSKGPAVNLERKPCPSEQIDFRTALARKVDVPVKNEDEGGVQVDFRNALRNKVEKPVFEKTPTPAAQIDFRTKLSKKVQTRTIEDKNLAAEQKDFRVVLEKVPLSPKTGRRHRGMHQQESVDRTSEDLDNEYSFPANPLPELREIPKADVDQMDSVNSFESEEEKSKVVHEDTGIGRDSHKPPEVELGKKVAKKAMPLPVKKKVAIPKVQHVEQTIDIENESADQETSEAEEDTPVSQPKEESDDEVDGNARNKLIARAERTKRRQAKEATEKSKQSMNSETVSNREIPKEIKDDDKSSEDKPNRRRSRRSEDVNNETRSERSSRRTRRLAALGDNHNDEEKKGENAEKEKDEDDIEPRELSLANTKHIR